MNAGAVQPRRIATPFGDVVLHFKPTPFVASRPMVVGVSGLFNGDADLVTLADGMGIYGDGCLAPVRQMVLRGGWSIETAAAALDHAIEAMFPNRLVVLVGSSIGATICLATRSPAVRRIVAIEPLLRTGDLWPVVGPLQKAARSLSAEDPGRRRVEALIGIGVDHVEGRDYRALLDGLTAPTDVLLGDEPLQPQRQLEWFPSLVDEPERRRLRANRRVRVKVAAGAGHAVQVKGTQLMRDVVEEACRRASAVLPYDAADLDEALFEATPVTAQHILHRGPGGESFAKAVAARQPLTRIETEQGQADAAAGPPVDVVALGATPAEDELRIVVERLGPSGHVVMRWTREESVEESAAWLSAAGVAAATTLEPGIVRMQRREAPPQPALNVQIYAYATRLMDIRARLPALMLRTAPELDIAYHPHTFPLPRLGYDAPKMAILQRPGDLTLETWRGPLGKLLSRGWLLVIEYDDHPALVAEVVGGGAGTEQVDRFAYGHAIQTSTPALVDFFRTLNPDVALFPNAVFELLPFPKGEPPRRVFYGGVLRGAYAVEVARSLRPVVDEFPDVEFVVIGDRAVYDALPTQNKVLHPYLSYEGYLAEMSRCAVSLSPVAPRALWATKSDAKFLDAARAGVLTIGSPVCYDRVIRHGVNGLLAADMGNWAELLAGALRDPAGQRRMAKAAWEDVRRERMFAYQARSRIDWYWSLWARREELRAALFDRVPALRSP